jgi:hypothetical protein
LERTASNATVQIADIFDIDFLLADDAQGVVLKGEVKFVLVETSNCNLSKSDQALSEAQLQDIHNNFCWIISSFYKFTSLHQRLNRQSEKNIETNIYLIIHHFLSGENRMVFFNKT